MDTGEHVMPPKAQLAQQEIDEIVAGINQVNALRVLSKKFKIGQGRIRRIWGQAGVTYRENYTTREKVGYHLTTESDHSNTVRNRNQALARKPR